jgi:hypothetical protein
MERGDDRKRGFRLPGKGWRRSLLAVMLGNLLYYASYDYLPPWAQNKPFAFDLGLALNFWVCVVVYILIRFLFPKL